MYFIKDEAGVAWSKVASGICEERFSKMEFTFLELRNIKTSRTSLISYIFYLAVIIELSKFAARFE